MLYNNIKYLNEVNTIKKLLRVLRTCLIVVVIQICLLVVFDIPMVMYGPFSTLRTIYVTTAMTTMSHQYLAKIFLSDNKIKIIMDNNKADFEGKTTDITAINIPDNTVVEALAPIKKDKITFEDISNSRYKGYILMVSNPARVSVGSTDKLNKIGMKLDGIIDRYNAIGGINAGGFADPGGRGNGGIPMGVLIENGQVLTGTEGIKYYTVGLNQDSQLVLGSFTLSDMRDRKIANAVTFDPFLIVNGEPTVKPGSYPGGLDPRTVIGQKQDGTIIFLVIDGRQIGSLGATLEECQNVMLSHGAYNAANLDGGASTEMIYNNKIINHPSSSAGPRYIPSAFIISRSIDPDEN